MSTKSKKMTADPLVPAPMRCTVVLPVYNEVDAVGETITQLVKALADLTDALIIAVDDGSTDGTSDVLAALAQTHENVLVVTHETNRGYGAALKTGMRHADHEYIVITDADGTYPNQDIPKLLERCRDQDMVVGARTKDTVVYSSIRKIPKVFLTAWVSWIAGRKVPDINSGLRVFRKSVAEHYLGILPDGFSFTITITLAMLTNFRRVVFVPIDYAKRIGRSKIRPIRDTLRFLTIVLRTGTYFAPMRLFMPLAAFFLVLTVSATAYDVFVNRNLSDKVVILFMLTFNIGMFGLLADMIDKRNRH